jgi:tRNA-dihydrouridine synthase
MEDVTDTVFRYFVLRWASPKYLKVVMSEFLSVDGFLHPEGREKVHHRLYIHPLERKLLRQKGIKIIAQIWGTDPRKFEQAARIISQEYEFDGIDINMGCPMKKIIKNGACSALILNPELARDIIQATQSGTHLPVSVKTRLGMKQFVTQEWITALLAAKPASIGIHGRIQKQLYSGKAHWDEIRKAVQIRNHSDKTIAIQGNGDVFDIPTGLRRIQESGVDGIMIGRGILKNPWFFNDAGFEITSQQKIRLLLEHTKLYEDTWQGIKSFAIMKRFFKMYISDFKGAVELRGQIMPLNSYDEIRNVLEPLLTDQKTSDIL